MKYWRLSYSVIVSISCQLHWVIELKHTTEWRSSGVATDWWMLPGWCCIAIAALELGKPKKQNNASREQNKSSATPNRDRTIHCHRKHRRKKKASRQQCRRRNQHLTHTILRKPVTTPKQFQTTRSSVELTFNQQPFSGNPFVHLQKYLFGKAAPFFARRSLQQSHFRDRKHISFFGLEEFVLKFRWVNKSNFDLLA